MQRRSFLTFLGSAAAAWPMAARAQQGGIVRRIGMLFGLAASERPGLTAIRNEFATRGWIEDRNLKLDVRYGAGDPERNRTFAAELVELAPNAIITVNAVATKAVQQQTSSIPIIFVAVGDPVENGLLRSIARPEGNTTGFTNLYASIAGKWLEILKEAASQLTRVGVMFSSDIALRSYLKSVQDAAAALHLSLVATPVHTDSELVNAINSFASKPNGALVAVPPIPGPHRELIIRLAQQHRLPAIYSDRGYAVDGGLVSYGPDLVGLYRSAADYVDRVLRGSRVSELPVQFPTKFDLVVNLKTAKAIGLILPEAFLLRADEVIE